MSRLIRSGSPHKMEGHQEVAVTENQSAHKNDNFVDHMDFEIRPADSEV